MTAIETKPTFYTPTANRLATALQVATVAACLALGVAFVGTLMTAPTAPPPVTAQSCPAGAASC
jgi:hypothetical protein